MGVQGLLGRAGRTHWGHQSLCRGGQRGTRALCSGMEEQHPQIYSTTNPLGSAQLTLPRLVVAIRGLSRRRAWMQILYPCSDSPGMEMGQVLLSQSLQGGITDTFQGGNEEQTAEGRTGSPGVLT